MSKQKRIILDLATAQFDGYTCAQMRAHYNFPAHLDGSGQTIGLAEWGSGYSQNDLDGFCKDQGLPPITPEYIVIDGGQNTPDAECTLDIEVAHGMAPGAKIRVYEAPAGPNYQTFWDQVIAVLTYISNEPNPPSVLSISYGDAESDWSAAQVQAADALIEKIVGRGCTVLVASGDQGALGMHDVYADPQGTPNADAPATCPHAVAIGGTCVPLNGAPERAWNVSGYGATGGGFSTVFPRPSYQDAVNQNAMRGEPDFSMLADPQTGWRICFNGQVVVIGGTSAASPAAAALIACVDQERANQGLGPVGDILPTIYAHEEVFTPITIGNNSFMGAQGYAAQKPWSACCGIGVPDATKFVALFVPSVAPAKPNPSTEPVYVEGAQQSFSALLQDGMAYVPAVLAGKALGWNATRNAKGVYFTKPATPSLWQRIFGG